MKVAIRSFIAVISNRGVVDVYAKQNVQWLKTFLMLI